MSRALWSTRSYPNPETQVVGEKSDQKTSITEEGVGLVDFSIGLIYTAKDSRYLLGFLTYTRTVSLN